SIGAIVLLLGAAGALGLAVWCVRWASPKPSPEGFDEDPFPVPALSASPFLNVNSEAQFVGSEACRECHPSPCTSHGRTGMGRSMAKVSLDSAFPDSVFDHPLSGRRYQVYHKDGALWHRELLLVPGANGVVLGEYPIHWVIGSGRHWQTFLTEVDGFL